MQFQGTVDRRWIVLAVVLGLLCVVSLIPTFVFAARGAESGWLVPAIVGGIAFALLLGLEVFLLAPFKRSYVALRERDLCVVFGLRKRTLDYRFITAVYPRRDALNTQGWAGSLQGVMIENDVEDFMVSVKDEAAFIAELVSRCPRARV